MYHLNHHNYHQSASNLEPVPLPPPPPPSQPNGVVTLTNLTFQLAIIPKSIYLLTRPIEVLEGGHSVLTVSDLKIVTRYYADKVDSFLIVKLPVHGNLQLKGVSADAEPLTRFTYTQLIEKQVLYWHDGSEDANDTLEIVALAGNRFYLKKQKTNTI